MDAERLPEHMDPARSSEPRGAPHHPQRQGGPEGPASSASPVPEAAGLEPRTPVETILAGIWCEVLEVRGSASRRTSSIWAGTRCCFPRSQARVRDRIGREVSLVELSPTPPSVPWRAISRPASDAGGAGGSGGGARQRRRGHRGHRPRRPLPRGGWRRAALGQPVRRRLLDRRFSAAELAAAGVDPALFRDPATPAAGAIDGVRCCSTPASANSRARPRSSIRKQRVFLECAWEALGERRLRLGENAGAVGVFAGLGIQPVPASAPRRLDRSDGGRPPSFCWARQGLPAHPRFLQAGPQRDPAWRCRPPAPARLWRSTWRARPPTRRLRHGLGGAAFHLRWPQRAAISNRRAASLSPTAAAAPSTPRRALGARERRRHRGWLKRLADGAGRRGTPIRAVIRGSASTTTVLGKAGYTAPSVAAQAR